MVEDILVTQYAWALLHQSITETYHETSEGCQQGMNVGKTWKGL